MNMIDMMKKNFRVFMLVLLLAFASCSFTSKPFGGDASDKDKLLIQVITYVLEQGHYNPIDINDDFSKELLNPKFRNKIGKG